MLRAIPHKSAGTLTVCCWFLGVAAIDSRGADPPEVRDSTAEVTIPDWVKGEVETPDRVTRGSLPGGSDIPDAGGSPSAPGGAASGIESALSEKLDREGLREILTNGELLERMARLKELEQFQEVDEALRDPETGQSGLSESPLGEHVRMPGESDGPPRPWEQGESMLDRARGLRGGERGQEPSGSADRFSRLGWVRDAPPRNAGFSQLNHDTWIRGGSNGHLIWWLDGGPGNFMIIDEGPTEELEFVIVENGRVTDRRPLPDVIELDVVTITAGEGERVEREEDSEGEGGDDSQPDERDNGNWFGAFNRDPWKTWLLWYQFGKRHGSNPLRPGGDPIGEDEHANADYDGDGYSIGLNAVINPNPEGLAGGGSGGGQPYDPGDPFPTGPGGPGDEANSAVGDDPFAGYSNEDLSAMGTEGPGLSRGFVLIPPGDMNADVRGTGSPAAAPVPGFSPTVAAGIGNAGLAGLPNGGLFGGPNGPAGAAVGPNGGK